MPRRLLIAALLAALPASARVLPPSTLPGLAGSATRVIVDADAPPWRGVVRVQTELGLRCSGALIGPRLALTAAHCLFGRGTGRPVQPSSVHVLSGYRSGHYAGHATATALHIGPDFPSDPGHDWALITLGTPIGTADRILPLSPSLPRPGTKAMLGGYEQDRAERIVADTACTITGVTPTMLHHDCAATRGVSGAPLLARLPETGWAVVGIASTATLGQAGGNAVPITAIR